MSQREKILAATVAVMVLLWAGTIGLDRYRKALERNEQKELDTSMTLSRAKTAELRGRRAHRLLADWRKQSLPTNVDVAKTLYQDWLRKELDDSKLTVKEIREQSPRAVRANYQQATFVVTADGTLSQLTEFLYRFYQSSHLHRISESTMVPTENRKSLTVTLRVDALILPDANRSDKLAEGTKDAFEQTLEEIEAKLKARNIFVAYEPPKPPQPEVKPGAKSQPVIAEQGPDKEAESAYFSGITHGASGWRMSIRLSDSGKLLYFNAGDQVEIGRFSAKILELDGRRVILEAAQGRLQLSLGQNFSQVRQLPKDNAADGNAS